MERGGGSLRQMFVRTTAWLVRGVAAGLAVVLLTACGSISEKMAGPLAEAPAVGLPADAPARPVQPASYPPVHDMPPARSTSPLTAIEQKQFEDDLLAAQKEQQKQATAPPEPGYIEPDPPPPPPKKTAKKSSPKPAAKPAKPSAAQADPSVTASSGR
jgi:hypothetical protein